MAVKKTVKPVAVTSAATTPKAEAKKTVTPAEVKTEVKAETKKAEAPAAEVKTEVKAAAKAEKPAAVKKETVKKETVKKAPAKKAPARKATRTTAKKAEIKSEVHVQFSGKSYTQEDLVKIAKDVWKYDLNGAASDLTSIELYVKPEEQTVYYVMNKEFTGSFAI